MKQLMLIAIGGAIGAVCRFAIGEAIHRRVASDFPFGTLAVNIAGCLAIGFLLQVGSQSEWLSPSLRAILITGFLGALTTFSTFGHDTVRCADSSLMTAMVNIGANVALGLSAVVFGITIARLCCPAP